MNSIDFELKTISDTGNFGKIKLQIFVIYKGYVYFLDVKRLGVILSLMQLLLDFNEYINKYKTSNLTCWMKSRNLLTKEILEEILLYKIKSDCDEKCRHINHFSHHIHLQNSVFKNELLYLFKTNLKNAILFEYMAEYNDEFNKFISDIFKYFKKNSSEIFNQNLSDFADYIFTAQKQKMFEKLSMIDNLNVLCNFNGDFSEFIEIKKSKAETQDFYFECIRKNSVVNFTVIYDEYNDFCINPDKYLQLAEFLNNNRLIDDNIYYSACPELKNICNITALDCSNFSFINSNQLLFSCLNDENKILANELLKRSNAKITYQKFNVLNINYFDYLDLQRFLNYCYIKIQD